MPYRSIPLLAALLVAAPAMATEVTALPVVEAGLFRATRTGHIDSPRAVNERTHLLDNVVFYSFTSKVPAKLGIRFGTRFRVVGVPANRSVMLRSVWRIPEPGIVRPETGTRYLESIADTTSTTGSISVRGYTFDAAWEIRCGDWIQEVWFGERKLLSQTFTVENCEGVPISAREPGAALAGRR